MTERVSSTNINICSGKKTPVFSKKAATAFLERGKVVRSKVSQRLKEKHEVNR